MSKGSLPGAYPKTPEERAAAAKKYNMRVEDYEPFPDNGEGYVLLFNKYQLHFKILLFVDACDTT